MPARWFQYTDSEVRDYHAFGRVGPGDVVQADPADFLPPGATHDVVRAWTPDHRFTPVTAAHARRVLAARTAGDPAPITDTDADPDADPTTDPQMEG